MEIKRDKYLNQLIKKQHNGLVKVITGVRRCGKSYLLFTLFKNYLIKNGINKDSIIEMSFDRYRNKKYRDSETFYKWIIKQVKSKQNYYVFLDEVQLLNNFEEVLIDLMSMQNVDLYVTGSNAKLLSKDIITEFRGRGDEIRLYPLTFKEFISSVKENEIRALEIYYTYGGMPEILNTEESSEKNRYLKNLFSEIYINDIVDRNNIKNQDALETILKIIASDVGSLTNPKKISDTFKTYNNSTAPKSETIRNYIECFKDAFIINEAMHYDVKGRNYIGTPFKYYFCDTGLRNALINFRQVENNHLMENVIYNELIYRGYNVDVGIVPVRKRDGKIQKRLSYEIDFICNNHNQRLYIQSAYQIANESKLQQEQKSLLNVNDAFKKIIIVNDFLKPTYINNGILMMGIYDFLTNENSLSDN